jgi:hypothetical protein
VVGDLPASSGPRSASELPGTRWTRVFLGGSYVEHERRLLDDLALVVRDAGLDAVIADPYDMADEELHDVTLYLLHSCRLAVFECSLPSGALMEVERSLDYGLRSLILFRRSSRGPSPMLTSLAREHQDRMRIVEYERPDEARRRTGQWLRTMKRMTYDGDTR